MRRVWAWRVNSGAMAVNYRGAPAGTPDILVVLPPNGRLVGLEVKTATGQQAPSQVAWHAKAGANGVPYAVVRSTGEALEFLQKQFAQHRAKKEYLAIVFHVPGESEGRINRALARSKRNPMRRQIDPGGREAVTEWKLEKMFCLI